MYISFEQQFSHFFPSLGTPKRKKLDKQKKLKKKGGGGGGEGKKKEGDIKSGKVSSVAVSCLNFVSKVSPLTHHHRAPLKCPYSSAFSENINYL